MKRKIPFFFGGASIPSILQLKEAILPLPTQHARGGRGQIYSSEEIPINNFTDLQRLGISFPTCLIKTALPHTRGQPPFTVCLELLWLVNSYA